MNFAMNSKKPVLFGIFLICGKIRWKFPMNFATKIVHTEIIFRKIEIRGKIRWKLPMNFPTNLKMPNNTGFF